MSDFATTATTIAAVIGAPTVIGLIAQGIYNRIRNAPALKLERETNVNIQLGQTVQRLTEANARADKEAENRRKLQDSFDAANRALSNASLPEVPEPELYTTINRQVKRNRTKVDKTNTVV